jgi:hypothetical protein
MIRRLGMETSLVPPPDHRDVVSAGLTDVEQ